MARFQPGQFPESDARARRAWQTLRPEAADAASTDAAMRRLWRNVSRTIAEYSVIDRFCAEGRIAVEGAEHFHAVRNAGKPMLVAGLHTGNWEVPPVGALGLGLRGASLALILENRFERRLIEHIRLGYGGRWINAHAGSGKAIIREARERVMCIYIDEFIRGRVYAPAFGRPIKPEGNIAYVVRLAKILDCPIIPYYCTRLNDTAQFKVTILPPFQPVYTADAEADLMTNITALNSMIEPIIRAHLDQWFYVLDFEFDS